MKRFLFPIVFLVSAASAWAVSIDGDWQTVKDAYDAALPGGKVTIKGGDWTWPQPLILKKGVTIEGAGPQQTILRVNVGPVPLSDPPAPAPATANSLFQIDGGPNGTVSGSGAATVGWNPNSGPNNYPRISNLTMVFDKRGPKPANGMISMKGHVQEFRIDHCDIKAINSTEGDKAWAEVYIVTIESDFWGWGLFDHNHFDKTIGHTDVFNTDQPAWLPITVTPPNVASTALPALTGITIPNRTKGDGSWADFPHWAEGKCFRFEDNIFEVLEHSVVALSRGGARREMRYNTMIATQAGGHGAETISPGGRTMEFYNNRYWSPVYDGQGPYNSRSCASLVFNNRTTNAFTIDRVTAYRRNFTGKFYGTGSGANTWDSNRKGTFTDHYLNSYSPGATGAGGSTTPDYWNGDVYWSGDYTGPNVTNDHLQTGFGSEDVGFKLDLGPSLVKNGFTTTGDTATEANRWKGFMLYNKSSNNRIAAVPTQETFYLETAVMINEARGNVLTTMASGFQPNDPSMIIKTGDHLEIRCVDSFIHQPGHGKGDVVESNSQYAPNDEVASPRQKTATGLATSWNVTQSLKIYPDPIDPTTKRPVVQNYEGLWFWHNKGNYFANIGTKNVNWLSSDVLYWGVGGPSPNINVSDNPQQYELGRDVRIPGLDPTAAPTDPAGRPPGYPYDPSITGNNTRLRIGADFEAYNTFKYYNNGNGLEQCRTPGDTSTLPIDNCTIQPGATGPGPGGGNILIAASNYWGRPWPDYLINQGPRFTNVSSASWLASGVLNPQFNFTTAGFTGSPIVITKTAWILNGTPNTPPNVTFTPLTNGTATLTGTANGATPGTYTTTVKAEYSAGGESTGDVPFTLVITNPAGNAAPTVTLSAAPAAGTQYVAPAHIILTADPKDTDGSIYSVVFKDGATTKGTVNGTPWVLDLTGVAAGTHPYTAVATDDKGSATTSSPPTSVTVTAAPVATPTPAKIILKP